MDEFVVESTDSEVSGSSESEELKRKLLFPCLDRMISELEKRFPDCSPTSDHFLSEPHLLELALHYHIDL